MAKILLTLMLVSLVAINKIECCKFQEFQCRSDSKCIPFDYVCDKEKDCIDNSDEEFCLYRNHTTAPQKYFLCRENSKHIYIEWLCNGHKNCDNGSDEENCPKNNCITAHYKCDEECKWGQLIYSNTCNYPKKSFSTWHFECNGENNTTYGLDICDGYNDCANKFDETYGGCKTIQRNSTCKISDFPCNDGTCGIYGRVCNGKLDNCGDGSDELNCNPVESCPNGHFMCGNGQCFNNAAKCDGHRHCIEGTDEWNCSEIEQCNSCEFKCILNKKCIPMNKRCDGCMDCGDGTDENNCQNITTIANCLL